MLRVAAAADAIPAFEPLAFPPEVEEGVRDICRRVREEGDAALVELTRRFDGADVAGRIRVAEEEFDRAATELDPGLASALAGLAGRLGDLHGRQLPRPWSAEAGGVRFGEVVRPVAAAGAYAPGGRASYPSTVLMTTVPARVAGVERVVVCTPPSADGSVAAPILVAARMAGVDAVYRVGGAQAVAAMAYGTETVPRVDTIVGPGNVWVTAAKREVAGTVGIDGLAGPTELVIVADGSADPAVLAADLVAQAEHDPLARVTLVCLDPSLVAPVDRALELDVAASPRREVVEASLRHAVAIVAETDADAAGIVDRMAPEHLQVVTRDAGRFLDLVRSYGAAFLGPLTPVAFGDYGVGSNHVLPTMRTARFASGLRAADFVTVSSVVEATAEGLEAFGPEIQSLALAEGLPGHAAAVQARRARQGPDGPPTS
ncbi:MAG: histidinol dehydrogenase [Actinomycetota bacterium]|nr:histidinol dehydrogenase [Actinomycetota bacterium]